MDCMWIVLPPLKRSRLQARSISDLASTNVLDGRTQYPHGDVKRCVGGHVDDQCKHVHESTIIIFSAVRLPPVGRRRVEDGAVPTTILWTSYCPREEAYIMRSNPPWLGLRPLLGGWAERLRKEQDGTEKTLRLRKNILYQLLPPLSITKRLYPQKLYYY